MKPSNVVSQALVQQIHPGLDVSGKNVIAETNNVDILGQIAAVPGW